MLLRLMGSIAGKLSIRSREAQQKNQIAGGVNPSSSTT
jgi:hypothetical protein